MTSVVKACRDMRNRRRALICACEIEEFEGNDRQRLLDYLKDYIGQHRDSENEDELVAVGSAIRKAVALDRLDLDWLIELVQPTEGRSPRHEVKFEVARVVYRTFVAFPPEKPDPMPELGEAIADMAIDYLRDRLLAREKHAAIAILASQATLVMLSPRSREVIEAINGLSDWFRDQIKRRMRRVHRVWPEGLAADLSALMNQIK